MAIEVNNFALLPANRDTVRNQGTWEFLNLGGFLAKIEMTVVLSTCLILSFAISCVSIPTVKNLDPDWEMVGKGNLPDGYYNTPAFALANGNVHVVVTDKRNSLHHAWFESGKYQIEVVDEGLGEGSHDEVIAITDDGTIHVVYIDRQQNVIKHAFRKNGPWEIHSVDEATSERMFSRIAASLGLTREGFPVVAYSIQHADRKHTQKVATWDGESWHTETLTQAGDRSLLDLTVGPDDKTHLIFVESRTYPLSQAPDFVQELVELKADTPEKMAMLKKAEVFEERLQYATSDSGWVGETVWTAYKSKARNLTKEWEVKINGGFIGGSTIRVGQEGTVHITHAGNWWSLREGRWSEHPLAQDGSFSRGMVIDTNGRAHRLMEADNHIELRYAISTEDGWQSFRVGDVYHGEPSLALDETGNPVLCFISRHHNEVFILSKKAR